MHWSDPPDEPSPEARRVQRQLRRAGPVIAFLAVLMAVLMML